jgi:phosphate:Na+ symporter
VFERVLSQVGRHTSEDVEDYSTTRYLDARLLKDLPKGVGAIQQETIRYLDAASLFLAIARRVPTAPEDAEKHFNSIDVLSRDIRQFTANMFDPNMPYAQANLIASLIEEEDWTASLGETLFQVARRIERQSFGKPGQEVVDQTLDLIAEAMRSITPQTQDMPAVSAEAAPRLAALLPLRERALRQGAELPWVERGAILTLLGSAERAFNLIERIDAERRSVSRSVVPAAAPAKPEPTGGLEPIPVPA